MDPANQVNPNGGMYGKLNHQIVRCIYFVLKIAIISNNIFKKTSVFRYCVECTCIKYV